MIVVSSGKSRGAATVSSPQSPSLHAVHARSGLSSFSEQNTSASSGTGDGSFQDFEKTFSSALGVSSPHKTETHTSSYTKPTGARNASSQSGNVSGDMSGKTRSDNSHSSVASGSAPHRPEIEQLLSNPVENLNGANEAVQQFSQLNLSPTANLPDDELAHLPHVHVTREEKEEADSDVSSHEPEKISSPSDSTNPGQANSAVLTLGPITWTPIPENLPNPSRNGSGNQQPAVLSSTQTGVGPFSLTQAHDAAIESGSNSTIFDRNDGSQVFSLNLYQVSSSVDTSKEAVASTALDSKMSGDPTAALHQSRYAQSDASSLDKAKTEGFPAANAGTEQMEKAEGNSAGDQNIHLPVNPQQDSKQQQTSGESGNGAADESKDQKTTGQMAAASPFSSMISGQGLIGPTHSFSSPGINSSGATIQSSSAIQPMDLQDGSSSGPMKEIVVRLEGQSGETISVRLMDQGGKLQVAVRSSDPATTSALKQDLPSLSSSLDRIGWKADLSMNTGAHLAMMHDAGKSNGDSQDLPNRNTLEWQQSEQRKRYSTGELWEELLQRQNT